MRYTSIHPDREVGLATVTQPRTLLQAIESHADCKFLNQVGGFNRGIIHAFAAVWDPGTANEAPVPDPGNPCWLLVFPRSKTSAATRPAQVTYEYDA